MKKKILSIFTILAILCSFMVFIPDNDVIAKDITVFSQTDGRWGNHYYGYSDSACTQRATISSGGCGILAYVNAVYYLNGNFIEPVTLADWSVNNGYRVNGVGTSWGLYSAFANKYGSTYNIAYNGSSTSYSTLISHLQSGEVAIGSAPGHLMAIVDYDNSSGKFLILDSYKSSNRHTYSTGYTWETETSCKNTAKLNFSGFYFIKSNENPPTEIHTNIRVSIVGNSSMETLFEWDSISGASGYDLKIWKGTYWDGDPYYVEWNTSKTSFSKVLPEGHYEAYVDTHIDNGKMSNIVKFDVKKGTYLNVSVGNSGTDTTFEWTGVPGAKNYDLKIWKGTYWDGDAYYTEWGTTKTSFKKVFPVGHYEAYIDTNDNGQMSNVVKFDVLEGALNLGDDFDAIIVNAKHNKPIMMEKSISEGSMIVLGTQNNDNIEREVWHFKKNSDGSYRIMPQHNWDLSLDVENGEDKNGTRIGVWGNHDGNNQKWYIYPSSNGYILRPGCSLDKVLDLYENSSEDGTKLELWGKHGGESQVYSIKKFDLPEKTRLSVTVGTSYTDTKFSCTDAKNTNQYTLKIWTNIERKGSPFKEIPSTETNWSVRLPEGTYYAYVDTSNQFSYNDSNTVTVKVEKGTCSHSYDSWTITKAASCTADGSKTRKCSICGKSETAVITKTGHKYSDTVVKPTCIEKGYTLHKCSVCKNEYKDTYVDAKGHKHDSKIVFSTFTEKGYTLHTCSECGDSYMDNYTAVKITEKISEVVFLQQYFTKKYKLTDEQLAAADLNNDGRVNVFDMIILKRRILKNN